MLSKMMIANEMGMDDQHLLSNEYCFFDGKVKRCKNFVTLTASVYHPILQKQLPLATMECKSEYSANIGRFWNNFNKAFKYVRKTDKNFSPVGWIRTWLQQILMAYSWSTVKMYYIKSKDVNFISANQSATIRKNVAIRSHLKLGNYWYQYFIQIVFHESYWITFCHWVSSNFVMF